MASLPPWIIDAHLDLSLQHHRYGRDITQPLDAVRLADRDRPGPPPTWGTATVALPATRAGGIGMTFATLLALPRAPGNPPGECECHTPDQADAVARRDLAYYRQLESDGHLRIITDTASLEATVSQWDAGDPRRRIGLVVSMEGAEPIRSPGDVSQWCERGLRIVGPAWCGANRYAHGTGTPGGLTNLGRELLHEMSRVGMILDASHLAEAAFFEALDAFDGPVIASHSNARALVPGDRQLSDEMIRRLIERDAVIGVALAAWMLAPGRRFGEGNAGIALATVADHVDHVCQIAGDAKHVAIGSDLDGGFGREQSPADLDSIADLARLFDRLRARGFTDEQITAIARGNWLRVLRTAWASG